MRTWRLLLTAGLLGVALFPATSHGVISTFDADLDGWTQTSGVSWVASGGNPGGYAEFADTGPADGGQFFAPSAFHGDWLTLYGADGTFSIDYKLFAAGTVEPFSMWVRITGSGGVIAKNLPGNFAAPFDWTTFSNGLGAANWALASGTWAGALSDVTEVVVFMSSATSPDEITGVDNISVVSAPDPTAVPEPGTVLFLAAALGLAALWRRTRSGW